jgi:uncharacterized Zn finger protein
MSWDWDWYPRSNPRRPAHGIRAQTQRGQFGKTWWAGKWIAAIEELVDPARLQRGRSYARSGQVLNIDIQPGRVDSRVQGSRPQPYKVWIKIKPLSGKDWDRVADAMAAQAIFAAKLLAGEMPQDIEQAFAAARVNLFPESEVDLQTDCSCPDWSNPCKHIAAVYYLLGEQFDADPFLIFRLRGKNKDQIIAMLRARRSTPEPSTAAGTRTVHTPLQKKGRAAAESPIPLEKYLDRFWEAPDRLEDFQVTIQAPAVDAAPVKRFGAPGFWRAKEDFIEAFSSAYHSITETSLEIVRGAQDKRKA